MTTHTLNLFFKRHFQRFSLILSSICLLHCLALPLVIILLPAVSHFMSGLFETILILSIIPVSLLGFIPTWRNHKNYKLALIFTAGLLLILVSQYGVAHVHFDGTTEFALSDVFGGLWQRTFLMFSGVGLLAYATYNNNKHTHVCSNPNHQHH